MLLARASAKAKKNTSIEKHLKKKLTQGHTLLLARASAKATCGWKCADSACHIKKNRKKITQIIIKAICGWKCADSACNIKKKI
jgi:hypothetical protein